MKRKTFSLRNVFTILALVSMGVVFAAALVAINWWIASQFGTGADFLPAWNGARAFLVDNIDPYSRTVAEQTQVEVYGRLATGSEFPYFLDIPFPLLILFFPFAFIPDPVWARAVWMFFSEIGILALLSLAFQLTEWRPKQWFVWLIAGLLLLWYYPVTAFLDGSLSILLIVALVGALVALRSLNDEAAGILLAVASMHWQVTLGLWLFIVVGAYLARRWRVFFGFAMAWVVLGGLAFIIYPEWIWPAFFRAVAANLRAEALLSPGWFLTVWLPGAGARVAVGLTIFLALLLAFEWAGALRGDNFRRVTWAAALSLTATPLVGFGTSLANLAPLVFSFAVILPFVWERWKQRPYLALVMFALIYFALPLLLRWQLAAAPFLADGLIFLSMPLLVILGLYWVRWYVVRPPRTWLDEVKRELSK